ERRRIIQMAIECLETACGWESFDAVAGGETAGIPYAAWISESVSLPMLYVRKKPKGFGRDAQIEGDLKEGSRVLLVEDLATDGASKLNFINALRTAGADVAHAFVVFFYGVFAGAEEDLAREGVKMHYLATWRDVLAEADAGRDFPAASIEGVREFLADPVAWSAARGGRGG
ncbi:MAG: orotate phosphoribosyltransferase, partial [Rhodospirillales bacterium]|nr:orotate phosphoribosyltransferase [Rhodospirillales bacterium]